jgi:Tol biopolymer transport system component
MPAAGGEPRVIAHLFGGQGTINVPSWSPDSRLIAFVSNTQIPQVSRAGAIAPGRVHARRQSNRSGQIDQRTDRAKPPFPSKLDTLAGGG